MKAQRIVLGLALALGFSSASTSAFGQAADSPVVAARKQVTAAQTAVVAAKAALDKARVRVATGFKTTNPDFAKAEADAIKAKAEIDSSKQAAMTAVRAKPEYISAVNAKAAVQTKMRELQQAGGGQAEFNKLSEESIRHATTISTLERTAVEKDVKYNDAVARLAEANKVIEGFKSQIDEACAADPEYMMLTEQYTQAQAAVVTAEEGMKQAAVQQREAAAQAAKAKAEERKAKSKGN
ncbi:hypothetical protein [Humisphaera borealis]|uniref:DUF4398 domain-containing protein n=1 Tax=Humisphaera borealis TaxID=2807512 RepID=A0A7M2WSK8_9BACT|nr:hypothetical protein [Humisphaera borealis]QOV88264.1 hypothetical protein IPV69_18675 [Humisphaera borealis]